MSDEFDEVSRRLHGTTNGMVWAEEYARLFPDGTGDVGTMVGWFANAIEVGRSAGLAERDRLRAVVEHAAEALGGGFTPTPGVVVGVASLLRAALKATTDQLDVSPDTGLVGFDLRDGPVITRDVSPTTGERDRLRAVADAARRWADAQAVHAIAVLTSNPDHGFDELQRSEAILLAALREIGEPPE